MFAFERGTGREVTVLHEQPNAESARVAMYACAAARTLFSNLASFSESLDGSELLSSLKKCREPSDIDGLVYITFDKGGAWKYALARELEAAGISVNQSRIP